MQSPFVQWRSLVISALFLVARAVCASDAAWEQWLREGELRCATVLDATFTTREDRVDVVALVASPHIEEEQYTIELRPAAKIARREESFADELLRATDRAALLDAHPSLLTPRLAQALARRAILHASRSRHAESAAVIALGREIAERTRNDAAHAFILGAESVLVRRTAKNPADAIPVAEEAERRALRSGNADARVRLARAVGAAARRSRPRAPRGAGRARPPPPQHGRRALRCARACDRGGAAAGR